MKLRRPNKFDSDVDVKSVLSNLKRLEAIKATGILGRPPRADLDALTKEASERLHGLKARVTLVEGHRQVFASAFGNNEVSAVEQREESLDYSYCKWVVAYNDVLVVEDSLLDPLVKDSRGTIEHGLRSYLGVPLRSQGEVIGSFCVFDDKPREWSMDDLNGLEEIAHEIMQHIDDEIDQKKS